MKLIITNSSGHKVWAIVGGGEMDGAKVIYVEFFLTDDPVNSIVPAEVPDFPDGIHVDVPGPPDHYFVPEGYTFKTKLASSTGSDGESVLLVNIVEVIPPSAAPAKLLN